MQRYLILFACFSFCGCVYEPERGRLLPHTETVLGSDGSIKVDHPNGSLKIQSADGATRNFSGEGWKKRLQLIPREDRWNGSAGLYDPAPSNTPGGRLLVDEGRQFFSSESEALRFLNVGSLKFKPVYTNQGLVVGYAVSSSPGGEVRSVEIWQIYIQGKKPVSLRGANDLLFELSGSLAPNTAVPANVPVGYERVLNEKEYQPDSSMPNR